MIVRDNGGSSNDVMEVMMVDTSTLQLPLVSYPPQCTLNHLPPHLGFGTLQRIDHGLHFLHTSNIHCT